MVLILRALQLHHAALGLRALAPSHLVRVSKPALRAWVVGPHGIELERARDAQASTCTQGDFSSGMLRSSPKLSTSRRPVLLCGRCSAPADWEADRLRDCSIHAAIRSHPAIPPPKLMDLFIWSVEQRLVTHRHRLRPNRANSSGELIRHSSPHHFSQTCGNRREEGLCLLHPSSSITRSVSPRPM